MSRRKKRDKYWLASRRAANEVEAKKDVGTCPYTGKRMYVSKSAARFAAHAARMHGQMSSYKCDGCGYFHHGHLPPEVIAGTKSRDDLTTPRQQHRRGVCPDCGWDWGERSWTLAPGRWEGACLTCGHIDNTR